VTGLRPEQLDHIQKEILSVTSRTVPAYHPIVEPYVVEGRHILVLWAPGGQNRPYKAPVSLGADERGYGYYVRMGSSTVRARDAVETELLQLAANVPFDDRSRYDAEVGDLSLRLIQAYLQEVRSELFEACGTMEFPRLCRQMQIVDGPPENLRPRNVGLLFFTDAPHRFFPQAQIDLVHFPEGRAGEIREQRFAGPLGTQLREALAYIQRTVIVEHVVKRPDRPEAHRFVPFPYAAVEEALAHAVYHRGYDVREPIEVQITPEEMVITSYPGPDPSVRIDELNGGGVVARRYRNRRIGEFLKELRLTEGRGTGVPTIFKAMRENGSPEPRFDTERRATHFTTIFPSSGGIGPSAHGRPVARCPGADVGRSAQTVGNPAAGRYTAITFYAATPSQAQRCRQLSRNVCLHPLINAGLLAPTLPSSPRNPKQRYYTTELGRAVLEEVPRQT
jgi:ATP-dependent DNA helicase RecG